MMRVAALLSWVLGFGFGLPCAYGIWYLADREYVWTFMGFPTYGGGPFEDAGMATTVPLLSGGLFLAAVGASGARYVNKVARSAPGKRIPSSS